MIVIGGAKVENALSGLYAMQQGDTPTYSEFVDMVDLGYLDFTGDARDLLEGVRRDHA